MQGIVTALFLFFAFIGAFAVSAYVNAKSTLRGDSLAKMWLKSGVAGFTTMIAILTALYLVVSFFN